MPVARRDIAAIPVPEAAVDPHGRGILLTADGETRLVTPSQVAMTAALFGLPVEGLRRKLFDAGRPVHDVDDHLAQPHNNEEEDAPWPDDVPDGEFPPRRHRPRRLGHRLR